MALHFHNLQAPAASRLQAFQSSRLQARAATRLEWDFSDDFNRGDGALGAPWTPNHLVVSGNQCRSDGAAESDAYVGSDDDGERAFTIEDGEASIDIDCDWTNDTDVRWTLRYGDHAGDHRCHVGLYYDKNAGTWIAYWGSPSGVNIITSGGGQPPAGTLTLTVAKRLVTGSFNGSSAGGTVEVPHAPSVIRLYLGQDAANPADPWFDNLVSHMEGY